ncbi:MAG: hypothetical protein LAT50_12120 [Ectothiorhodospiraceae bacterium]|nr:hypothetical protein [Ectothiorhodospiraceae bacterium]
MSGFTESGRQTGAVAVRAAITHVSVHDGDPGDSGANEVASSRTEVTFTEASGGVFNVNNEPLVPVPEGAAVRWVGYWTAASGGEIKAKSQVSEEVFNQAGQYRVSNSSQLGID